MSQILKVERADEATDTNLDDIGAAVVHGPYLDAEMRQALVDAGKVFLVAREAVQRLHDQHVKQAVAGRVHHRQHAVSPHYGGTGSGAVVESLSD